MNCCAIGGNVLYIFVIIPIYAKWENVEIGNINHWKHICQGKCYGTIIFNFMDPFPVPQFLHCAMISFVIAILNCVGIIYCIKDL
jgi:hypothetical protein